jgi:hypothetical protein
MPLSQKIYDTPRFLAAKARATVAGPRDLPARRGNFPLAVGAINPLH